jgi:preprotein translocase subunit SecD
MQSIRNRLLVIGALVALSIFYLFPRDITIRERGQDGVMRDVKVTRVPLKRGLDLQGGMHLALELDESQRVSADKTRDIELALTVLRKRIDEFGVAEPLVQKSGSDRIVVELAGLSDPARAKNIVQKSAFLEFRITDKSGALEKALPSLDRILRGLGVQAGAGTPRGPSAVTKILGDTALRSDSIPADSARVEDTGPGVLANLIQPAGGATITPMPGAYMVPESAYPRVDSMLNIPQVKTSLPRNIALHWMNAPISVGVESYRLLYALEDRPIVTGTSLVDAQAQLDPLTNGPIVVFELDRAGARRFGAETGRHVGDFMAILLDGVVQGQPPVIQSRIDRRGQITLGNRTLVEAQDLALTLKAGALPVPLKIVEERQVGASLGQDAIRSGVTAGIIGTVFVVLVMIGYYKMSGALAVTALLFYLLFTLGGLAMFESTLTLPGLAGLVLSIGIAVDANVLIFERIREELELNKTVRLSVDEGFRNAMSAIVDSNVTTVLTALFLFQFGTGPVRGFAVTLVIGILASMITAIFVTRTLFLIWLQRRPNLQALSI